MANPDPKMDPALASMETLAHLASTALAKYERDYETRTRECTKELANEFTKQIKNQLEDRSVKIKSHIVVMTNTFYVKTVGKHFPVDSSPDVLRQLQEIVASIVKKMEIHLDGEIIVRPIKYLVSDYSDDYHEPVLEIMFRFRNPLCTSK